MAFDADAHARAASVAKYWRSAVKLGAAGDEEVAGHDAAVLDVGAGAGAGVVALAKIPCYSQMHR